MKKNRIKKVKTKKKRISTSITTKLIVTFALIFLVTTFTLTYSSLVISESALRNTANENYNKILQLTSNSILDQIYGKFNLLYSLSMNGKISDSETTSKEKATVLQEYAEMGGFIRVGYSDLNGNLVFTDSQVNIKDREYFKEAANGNPMATDPIESIHPSDKGSLVTCYSSPVIVNDKVVGVVVGISDIKELSDIVSSTITSESEEIKIYDKSGKVIASNNYEIVNNFKLDKNSTDKDLAYISERILSQEQDSVIYEKDGIKTYCIYTLIDGSDWMMSLEVSEKELLSDLGFIKKVIPIIFIIAISIGILIVFIQARKMSRVLNTTATHLDTIAEGKMTLQIDEDILKRDDEFGYMTNAMNKMKNNMSETLVNIKDDSIKIEGFAEELAKLSEEMTIASRSVADAIKEIAKGNDEQTNDMNNILQVLNDFNIQLEKVMGHTNEIGNKSEEIYNFSKQSNYEMGSITNSVKNVGNAFSNLSDKVNKVDKTVEKIHNITVIINSIADQTNLLALNANIEAARVGEYGKGFAVVSNEIRKLAEECKISANDISKLLNVVSDETNDMVQTTLEVKKEIDGQGEILNNAINSFENINNSVEEIKPMIDKNIELGRYIEVGKEEIIGRIQSAYSVSEEVSAASEEITATVLELDQSTGELDGASKELLDMTKEMKNQMNRFEF